MGLAMLGFWVAVFWFIVRLTGAGDPAPKQDESDVQKGSPALDDARATLAERMARGEIDVAEYRERLETLG